MLFLTNGIPHCNKLVVKSFKDYSYDMSVFTVACFKACSHLVTLICSVYVNCGNKNKTNKNKKFCLNFFISFFGIPYKYIVDNSKYFETRNG